MAETPQDYIQRMLSHLGTDDPWTILATTAPRLRELIAGCTPGELARTPAPGNWSIAQILAHLADAEVVAAWRVRSVLASDGVALQPFDQNIWAEAFRYDEADPFESLQLFEVNRSALLSLLRRVDTARYAHHGMHAERGRETIDHLVRLYAGHDRNHLAQVERLVRSSEDRRTG